MGPNDDGGPARDAADSENPVPDCACRDAVAPDGGDSGGGPPGGGGPAASVAAGGELPPDVEEVPTVPCPVCGEPADIVQTDVHRNPDNIAVDKIVFDGVARWATFDDALVYRIFHCDRCDCDLRQVEWDGERETPMMDPTCEPAPADH